MIRQKEEEENNKNSKKKPKKKFKKKVKKKKKKKKTTEENENAPPPPITALSFKFTKIDSGTILMIFLASNEPGHPNSIKFWHCLVSDQSIGMISKLLSNESNFLKLRIKK